MFSFSFCHEQSYFNTLFSFAEIYFPPPPQPPRPYHLFDGKFDIVVGYLLVVSAFLAVLLKRKMTLITDAQERIQDFWKGGSYV